WLRLANKPYKPYKPRASWCGEQRCLVSAFGADSGVGSLSAVRGTLAAAVGVQKILPFSGRFFLCQAFFFSKRKRRRQQRRRPISLFFWLLFFSRGEEK
ncbi:MAG: hypothetical protein IJW17_09035, partial [Lentisphaeria bacterium]|nr:hypothetical protein [Lentisphaeria bacterium]